MKALHLALLVPATLVAFAVGCSQAAAVDAEDALDQEAALSTTRIFGVVDTVLAPGDHDGVAGEECVVLITAERRARKVLLVEPASSGGCSAQSHPAGSAVSFTWGDTKGYGKSDGAAALRAAVGSDAAVHVLAGSLKSEAAALAELQTFLALPAAEQAQELAGPDVTSVRVHSQHDFEGAAEVAAEAAYHAVSVTQPCEQPGSPKLEARMKGGFVFGYVAKNSGSCHSGWFSKKRVYNRAWTLIAQQEYSE